LNTMNAFYIAKLCFLKNNYEVRYMSHRHFNVKFTINNVRLGVMAVTSRAMTSE